MNSDRELKLRERLWESKEYCPATRWMSMYNPEKLNALIQDAAEWDVESDPYLQLAQKCMNQTELDVLGLSIVQAVETTFVQNLTREQAVALATIMEESGMWIKLTEDIEIRSNGSLIQKWNELHGDQKEIHKTTHYPDI